MALTIHNIKDLEANPDFLHQLTQGQDINLQIGNLGWSISLHAEPPQLPEGNLTVQADFHDIRLSRIADLAHLIDSANFDIIPSDIPVANDFALHDLKLGIDPTTREILAVTIDIQSVEPWRIVENKFELDTLTFSFMLFDLSPPISIFCNVFGTFNINGVELDASISLPDLDIEAEIPVDHPINLTHLLAEVLPNANLQNFQVSRLNLGLNPKEKTYNFQCTIDEDWPISLGVTTINLTRISMSIAGTGTSKPTGQIDAVLNIAGVDVLISAAHPDANAGWQFTGQIREGQEIPIGTLIGDLMDKFGHIDLPDNLTGMTIDKLSVSFNTESKDFSFVCEGKVPVDGHPMLIPVQLDIQRQDNGSYAKVFIVGFNNQDGVSTHIQALIKHVSAEIASVIPASLTVTLKDALFALDAETETKLVFMVDVNNGLNLSNLPLVGKAFSADETVKLSYRFSAAKGDFKVEQVKKLNGFMPDGIKQLPEKAFKSGVDLSATVDFGGRKEDVGLPVKVDENSGQVAQDPQKPQSSSSIQWFKLQKTFGPVQLEKVGLQFANGELAFFLNAALSMAGLTLSLDGLSVSSPIDHFAPSFNLRGLGLDVKKEQLEIGGAFLRQPATEQRDYDEYDGTAVVKYTKFALDAIGSYARPDGHPSLFLFAVLNAPFGGPPIFFIEGIAAGFGYNRAITMPSIDKVNSFPLVEVATGEKPAGGLEEELEQLKTYLAPAVGEDFLAVGVKFSSFKVVHSFALLTRCSSFLFLTLRPSVG